MESWRFSRAPVDSKELGKTLCLKAVDGCTGKSGQAIIGY